MKTCPKCGEVSTEPFDSCWRCSTSLDAQADNIAQKPLPPRGRKVAFEIFRGTFSSWEELFAEAAEFATQAGPGNLINISHSEDKSEGVVVVWYWAETP